MENKNQTKIQCMQTRRNLLARWWKEDLNQFIMQLETMNTTQIMKPVRSMLGDFFFLCDLLTNLKTNMLNKPKMNFLKVGCKPRENFCSDTRMM